MRDTKQLFALFGLAIFALSIQSLVRFYQSSIPFSCPQLILILVFYTGFTIRDVRGLLLSFFLGLLNDFATGLVVGPWAGAYTVVYTLLALISQGVFTEAISTIVVGALVANVVATSTYVLLSFSFTGGSSAAVFGVIVESLVTAIVAPVIFAFIRWFFRKLGLSRSASVW